MNRSIAVLTYAIEKHRKTYDVMLKLKEKGYEDVCVYARPHHYVKKFFPLYEHRPSSRDTDISTEDLAKKLGYEYHVIAEYEDIKKKKDTIFLVCGAGILPDDMLQKCNVINAHPGYIPVVRGLDSLKWAIYDFNPIGVSSHLISPGNVDAGEIIERKVVEIFPEDTFQDVANRQYELEVTMLIEAIEKFDGEHEWADPGENLLHKRMPHDLEKELLLRFEEYKRRYLAGMIKGGIV